MQKLKSHKSIQIQMPTAYTHARTHIHTSMENKCVQYSELEKLQQYLRRWREKRTKIICRLQMCMDREMSPLYTCNTYRMILRSGEMFNITRLHSFVQDDESAKKCTVCMMFDLCQRHLVTHKHFHMHVKTSSILVWDYVIPIAIQWIESTQITSQLTKSFWGVK